MRVGAIALAVTMCFAGSARAASLTLDPGTVFDLDVIIEPNGLNVVGFDFSFSLTGLTLTDITVGSVIPSGALIPDGLFLLVDGVDVLDISSIADFSPFTSFEVIGILGTPAVVNTAGTLFSLSLITDSAVAGNLVIGPGFDATLTSDVCQTDPNAPGCPLPFDIALAFDAQGLEAIATVTVGVNDVAVPEPATLLLFSTGLGVLCRKRVAQKKIRRH